MKLFTRKSWVANRADPTQVTQWKASVGYVRLTLLASWDVEMVVEFVTGWNRFIPARYRQRRFRVHRSYGSRFGNWLFGRLEDAHLAEEAKRGDDPMGRLADYE